MNQQKRTNSGGLAPYFATAVALGRPPAGSSVKQGPHFAQALLLVEQGGWSGGGHLLPEGPSWGLSSGLILCTNMKCAKKKGMQQQQQGDTWGLPAQQVTAGSVDN